MTHGCGYRQDKLDDRDLSLYAAGSSYLDVASDLSPLVEGIFNQGSTSTCVAQAIAAGVDVRAAAKGEPKRRISRLFPYYFGRAVLMRVVDMGSRPRDVLHALSKMGSPTEVEWPFVASKVNSRPPAHVRRLAADLEFSYARCRSISEVALALSSGQPVAVGFFIDEAFTKNEGAHIIDGFESRRIGGHMMLAVGNDPGLRAFKVLNSWGAGWRAGGYAWLSHECVQREAIDKWAIY